MNNSLWLTITFAAQTYMLNNKNERSNIAFVAFDSYFNIEINNLREKHTKLKFLFNK